MTAKIRLQQIILGRNFGKAEACLGKLKMFG